MDQVLLMTKQLFTGWGQTRIIEQANREIREQERFDSWKKAVSTAKLWDSLRSRGVIDKFDRTELDPEAGHSEAPAEGSPEPGRDDFQLQGPRARGGHLQSRQGQDLATASSS